jgi:Zn-dependent peptidase ImmA (M78 family)/DNA-binding XRE family transcriptional regulator
MTREVETAALAKRVRAARSRLRLSQADLARAAEVSQATVSRIETGGRAVSLIEADKIATTLDVPLETLLYGSAVRSRVLVALRVSELERDRSPALDAGVELLELDERLDGLVDAHRQRATIPSVSAGKARTPITQGRNMADALRELLALGLSPVVDLTTLIEDVTGVDVATRPLSGVAGMCLSDPDRHTYLLMASSSEPAERQRFTLAHELGHLLFADGAHVDLADSEQDPTETRANEFAHNFLLPQQAVHAWLDRNRAGDVISPVEERSLSLLTRYFAVSPMVVKIQLKRMSLALAPAGALPTAAALATRHGWRAEYEAKQTAARVPRTPRRLTERATVAFARGQLAATTLAHLEGRAVGDIEAELPLLTAQHGSGDDAADVEAVYLADLDALLARSAGHRRT